MRTAVVRPRTTHSEVSLSRRSLGDLNDMRIEECADIALLYGRALKHLQMQTYRLAGIILLQCTLRVAWIGST